MESPVVVGVDGSAESLTAAAWAAREAARRGAALRLLHVRGRHPRQGGTDTARSADHRLARRVLERAAERVHAVRPDVRVQEVQAEGPVAAVLAQAAEDADPLVLGSRGLGRVAGLLAGSVSLGVVARATRPVVLVRTDTAGDDTAADGDGRRDVVLGVDVVEPCDEVLAYAFEAARRAHARLRAVHAWRAPDRLTLGTADGGPAAGQERAEEWLRFLAAVLQVWRDKYPDVEVLETVAEGRPADALLKASSDAQLLVVGHRLPARPALPRTGPVTHAVIQQARRPLAVVPHG
ncbi:universal stress protein [Actinospica acidiphila]|uniref:universal stress protein n=1 Tax=Actinospica acidiphila TaxID=304899 RepID=UPI00193EE9DA|nr:universal stress protein [Actinospica acidiphila]MBM4832384.1 universal stress protein [Actinospica acidiphila]